MSLTQINYEKKKIRLWAVSNAFLFFMYLLFPIFTHKKWMLFWLWCLDEKITLVKCDKKYKPGYNHSQKIPFYLTSIRDSTTVPMIYTRSFEYTQVFQPIFQTFWKIFLSNITSFFFKIPMRILWSFQLQNIFGKRKLAILVANCFVLNLAITFSISNW